MVMLLILALIIASATEITAALWKKTPVAWGTIAVWAVIWISIAGTFLTYRKNRKK